MVETPGEIAKSFLVTGHCEVDFETLVLDPHAHTFWTTHSVAFTKNKTLAGSRSRQQAESEIVNFVQRIKKQFPRFYALSDNPSLDIDLLDQVLVSHAQPRLCIRNDQCMYFQCLCTWSYRLAWRRTLSKCTRNPLTCVCFKCRRNHKRLKINVEHMNFGQTNLKHTPFYDVVQTIEEFLHMREQVHLENKVDQHAQSKAEVDTHDSDRHETKTEP